MQYYVRCESRRWCVTVADIATSTEQPTEQPLAYARRGRDRPAPLRRPVLVMVFREFCGATRLRVEPMRTSSGSGSGAAQIRLH